MKRKLTLVEARGVRDSLVRDRDQQLPTWRLLAEFIVPNRLRENADDRSYGSRKDRSIIKNQAGRSLRTFVSGMMNGATPRARPWFNLTTTNKKKANSSTVRRYFSEVEGIINEHLQVSNFYRVLPMAYKDVGAFSNAAFAMLPHPKYGFYFFPFAIGTYGFACDTEGNTNIFYRDFALTVRQVVEQYGALDKNGKPNWQNIPTWVKQHWDNARYMEKITLSQVIIPNPCFFPDKKSLDPLDKKYQAYTFVHSFGGTLPPQTSTGFRDEKSHGKEPEFIKVSGFDYFPVITPRWEVAPEENYGVDGPGHIALNDIMTLQEMEKYRLEAVAKMVKPPMVGPAMLRRHQASILAGGITYVDDDGAKAGFRPAFEMDPKLSELIADQAEYTEAIRSAFYEDLFLMLAGSETKTHVTAREIEEKAGERMASLAPVLGQWDLDLNSKVIHNAQIILEQQGRLPKKPSELMGEQMRPEYISTLHQAAKVGMMNSLERVLNFSSSVSQAQQDPALLKLVKGEEAIRKYADYTGLDPSLIADEMEFEELKKEIAARNAEQLQAQQMAQGAETAKNLSQAKLGEGTALDAMMGEEQ